MKRRGLIAGAAALAAAALARRTAAPVGAVNPPFLLGQDNVPPMTNVATSITAYAGFGGGTTTLLFANASPSGNDINGVGGTGSSAGSGIIGTGGSNGGTGVRGTGGVPGAASHSGTGVIGVGSAGTISPALISPGVGVLGVAGGVAVPAATGNTGVFGIGGSGLPGVSGSGRPGVSGQSTNGGDGVNGYSDGGNGVYGFANAAGTTSVVAGVYGTSTKTYGVIGNTTAAGYSGLTAISSTPNVAALAATSTNANAYAAYFTGTTVVQGNFVAFGGGKSAAVPHTDGSHRLVYCVESPEAWFEDFGTGNLVGGKADVKLDRDFAAIVHTDTYHVFLTSHGNYHVHVAQRGPGGFAVRVTSGAGDALVAASGVGGTFSWRVVARRKDITGERLAKFALPKINYPDPEKLPKPSAPRP